MMLTNDQSTQLLSVLQRRFDANRSRHGGVKWEAVKERLEENPENCVSLYEMEVSGGEPDVVVFEQTSETYCFVDCVQESPSGRRSLCYDQEALEKRRKNKPHGNVMDKAEAMGVEVSTEALYRLLQKFGEFDTKTSS